MIVIATAVAIAALGLAVTPMAVQAPADQIPRTWDGHPDLSGIWQAVGTAHWDVQDHAAQPGPMWELGAIGAIPAGLGVVEGREIPYQPWAAAKKKENFQSRRTDDPEAKCYLPGVPRATYLPFPFQIVPGTNKIMVLYEFAGANRVIHMDEGPPTPVDTWMGYSVGRWAGETLVVDVTGFNDQTWFDRAGNFHSEALRVVERYTPISPYHLNYEVTIEDSKVFTRPWKISMPLYRRMDKNVQLLEFRCIPFAEELLYGHLRKQTTK